MSAETLAQAGAVVGAVGAAVLVLAGPRALRLAGLAAWAVGLVLFLPLLAPAGQRLLLVVGGLLAALLVAGLAYLLVRKPWALPFLTLAAAPARIPVAVGDTSANLLVPLYAVVAAAACALAWSLWREPPRVRELGPLSWPIALLVVWFGVSETWTGDVRNGAIALFFFVLPFVVLAVALARLRWSAVRVELVRGLLLAMAVLFAAVGIWQWTTHGVFWNERLLESNAYDAFYRVNSLFWDPSIYGRFLVLALLVALAALLFGRYAGTWTGLALAAGIGLFWTGLLFSFSQSSFVALAAGVVVAAVVAWRWRALAAVVVAAAVMVPVGIAAPQFERVRNRLTDASPTRITSHRSTLVGGGVDIWLDHPAAGVGIGGFNQAYLRREQPVAPAKGASHTTPVTVAAETGVVGFAFYVWLLVATIVLAFRRLDVATAAGRARMIGGICFVAVAVHSVFYSAFFEDPLTWGFMALVAVAARAGLHSSAANERRA
jgi:putative inorganic carbon (hco3(-)) transporter